jgi:hypothetical protein
MPDEHEAHSTLVFCLILPMQNVIKRSRCRVQKKLQGDFQSRSTMDIKISSGVMRLHVIICLLSCPKVAFLMCVCVRTRRDMILTARRESVCLDYTSKHITLADRPTDRHYTLRENGKKLIKLMSRFFKLNFALS